ncbi:MAG: RluA family pseudouridine synthase [Armatimonadota bacterium]|nr:RluA family pseudouridine synthase [Armatimonadota bacterium]
MQFKADASERLDLFLVRMLPQESRSSVARAITAGEVTVDRILRKASYKLSVGEVVTFDPPAGAEPLGLKPSGRHIDVLFEDEYLLVVDKPSGLSTHPSPTSEEPTLVHALLSLSSPLSSEAGAYRPGIVHRLDKNTSGLLLVAKNDLVHRKLQAAIQRKEVVRAYWAWVRGVPKKKAFAVRSYIGRHPQDRKKHAVLSESTPGARLAVTNCSLVLSAQGISKLECLLQTGRTHQIRVHLAAVGLPILGDPTYGVAHEGLDRQALHAVRLEFAHPITGRSIVLTSSPPDDLASVDFF